MPTHQQQSTEQSTEQVQTENAQASNTSNQLVGNQEMIDIIRERNQPTGQRELNPNKNGIVYLGLNKYSHDEANALNRMNSDNGGARSIKPNAEQDTIKVGGEHFDLRTLEGAASFSTTLGIADGKALEVAQFIVDADENALDEVAQFVQVLAEAEMGERSIERMVLSGHSVGSMIWGDDNGMINMEEFEKLSHIFPKAFDQVQHVMLSACYSGGETRMTAHQDIWREAESIFAYHDSSPGSWTGAMDHMGAWETATESGKDAGGVDPSLANGFRKQKNVSTWNIEDGYQGGKPMNANELRNQLQEQVSVFNNYFQGAQLVENSQSGPLRDYYNLVQRGISHPEIDNSLRADLENKRDTTIRLLYYSLVCRKFQEHHHSHLSQAYQSSHTELPDYSAWNRAEMLAHIEEMRGHVDAETQRLLDMGLRDLDSEVIPTTWV